MSFDFQLTQKGFKYNFIPSDLMVELLEASVEFSFKETETFKILKGMNEFEFTFNEFLTTVEYLIMKYQNATQFLNLSEHLNILSLINGFQPTKNRISLLGKVFPHQTNKKYIYAIDANRDETVKFVFNLEKGTITLKTNSAIEKDINVYLNISDFNRIILKLFALTNFGENNQKIKKLVSDLEKLSEKHMVYLIETVTLNKEMKNTNDKFYQSVKEEAKTNHKILNSFIEKIFSKNDTNKWPIDI